MKKTEIKTILKNHGLTMITKSYRETSNGGILLNCFDENGTCFEIWIDEKCEYATKQYLSPVLIHEPSNIEKWFFK